MTHSHSTTESAAGTAPEDVDLATYWESRYAESSGMWSGRVNAVLAAVVGDLPAGRAVDLGCGEGGDAVWLASRGWHATGVDVSATALRRCREAAEQAGVADRVETLEADLAQWRPTAQADLVTASFLHSWPLTIPREEILHTAARAVAPGGHLLVTSHAAPPPWADPHATKDYPFPTPEGDLAALGLREEIAAGRWQVLRCESLTREATGPDGQRGELLDAVVLVRRLA
ncbi:SAM-dependent methyltransferase [Serinibacter salmoneus]|uniref:Methyltransferase family protein n=1 Tax=Serinibacter salmoneus TaxID=556530 RepID=A0A2A9D227_9MICO|nr:class I SAM-dependent methyltransferase [Serinibacter salmoneus]PFG19909.1 methyltransferase family protein [Serinibacter salmoneus]